MKSLLEFIKESKDRLYGPVPLYPNDSITDSLYSEQFRILKKIFNLLNIKIVSSNKNAKYPFYFDGNSCVSVIDDESICNKCFLSVTKNPVTIEGLAKIIKKYIEEHKSEIEKEGFKIEGKPEIDKHDENRLKAISKETYANISGIFPNLEIGAKGGVSATYDISGKEYNITFSEKDEVLTIRYSINNGTPSRLAFGEDHKEVINKAVEKLKKWGLDLTKENN